MKQARLFKPLTRYGVLLVLVLASVGPFLWLLSTALKGNQENIFAWPPRFFPQHPTLSHFKTVWQQVNLLGYTINSTVVAILTIVMNLLISLLAAYPLARMRFKGQQTVFLTVLATMMLPFQVIMIPLYLMLLALGLTEANGPWASWLGLSIPFAVSGFGIFFVRQGLLGLPIELEEAAALDGANSWQTLWQVVTPLLAPTLGTLAVFTLISSWGEFLWPSIMLSSDKSLTLPVGLVQLQGQFSANWRLIAAGTILSLVPVLLGFWLGQRWLLKGQTAGAVKG